LQGGAFFFVPFPLDSPATHIVQLSSDFETGHLGAWQCTGSHCNILQDEDGGHHLEVRDRHSDFSGPWQLLHPLPGSNQLHLTFNFSIAASTDSVAKWKIRVTHGDEIKHILLSEDAVVAGDMAREL